MATADTARAPRSDLADRTGCAAGATSGFPFTQPFAASLHAPRKSPPSGPLNVASDPGRYEGTGSEIARLWLEWVLSAMVLGEPATGLGARPAERGR